LAKGMRLNVVGDHWVDLYEPGKVFPTLTELAAESERQFVDGCVQMLKTQFKTVHTYDRPWHAVGLQQALAYSIVFYRQD
jgi:hypothetical protein